MSKPKIGFLGLGLMGSAMVGRLQDQGYDLTVLGNRNRTGLDAAVARGAAEVHTGREVAEASDIVMLCMGTSDHVEARMRGDDGIIAGLSEGKVVIDFGTSLPASTKALGAEVAAKGAAMLDGPLGRTPAHAKDGLLNIMAAGDKDVFDRVEPVLQDLGENVFHLGALGAGHTVKLLNNFFGMTQAHAMCEAFAVADMAGIPRQQLYDVVSAGPLRSGMMDFVKAYAVEGNANMLEFSVRNARKDVGYYAAMAESLGVESLMVTGARQALGMSMAKGRGETMVSEQVDFFTELFSEDKG